MKRVFTMLVVLALIFSLVGCGNNNTSAPEDPEGTSGGQTMMEEPQEPIDSEPEDHQDNSGTAKKYDNPGDDPRMITQVNWESGYYAFIDQYNLIGYSYSADDKTGDRGAYYDLRENEGYLQENDDFMKFAGEELAKPSDIGSTHIYLEGINHYVFDIDGWLESLGITDVEVVLADKNYDGMTFIFPNGNKIVHKARECEYRNGDCRWKYEARREDMPSRFLILNKDNQEIVSDFVYDADEFWFLEKTLIYARDNICKNPW